MTRNGALAGMVIGAATVIVWKEYVVAQKISALYEMVPGVIAAGIAIVLVSKLGKPPSDEVQFRHKGVMETLDVHGY
nr:sodium:proline symporter [Xanthomonadaceae bacterium]